MALRQDLKKLILLGVFYLLFVGFLQITFFVQDLEISNKEESALKVASQFDHLVLNLSVSQENPQFFMTWNEELDDLKAELQKYPEFSEVKLDLEKLDDTVIRNNFDFTTIVGNPPNLLHFGQISQELITLAKGFSQERVRWWQINLGVQFFFFLLTMSLTIIYFFRELNNFHQPLVGLTREFDKIFYGQGQSSRNKANVNLRSEVRTAIDEIRSHLIHLEKRNEKLKKLVRDFSNKKKLITEVIESLPIGFSISNLVDKKVIYANKELADIYGFRPGFSDEINSFHLLPQEDEIAHEKGYPEDVFPADILMPREKKGQIIYNKKGEYQTIDLKRIAFKKEKLLFTLVTNVSELTEKEEELAANERISRFIFDTAEVGLVLVDEFGIMTRVNHTFCAIYGYTEGELIGQPFTILMPQQRRARFQQDYYKKMRKRSSVSSPLHEVQVVNKSGEILDVLSTSRTVFDHHFSGTIYSVLDVTEVRTSHGKLEAAIEGGKLGTWNFDIEKGHNEINHQWAEMLGYNKSEIAPSKEFFYSLIHPDDLVNFKREEEKIRKGVQNSFHQEIRFKCKNGSYKWILDSGKVIKRNAQGIPRLMAGCHVDIDDMKKAQLEIVLNSDRLRRAQEMGMVGDWELEVATDSFFCSPMIFRIFGRKRKDDFSYQEFLDLFNSTSAEKIKTEIENAIVHKRSFSHDAKIFLENGSLKHCKVIAVPILDSAGKVLRMNGILQDVTSIKTTKETLEETTKRLQVLSDNIPGGLIQLKVSAQYPPQILYLSKGAEKVWGLSREHALEGDVNRLLQHVHPNDHNIIRRSLLVASQRLERLNIIWRTISEAGELRWHHGVGIPAKNNDNTITWNALVLDITERKISEGKLREQEEYMHVLTQHASDAIIACDNLGRIRFVNETLREWFAPLNGSIPPEKWPRSYHLYSIEDDRMLKPEELSLFRALYSGKVINQEFLIKKPGEKERYVQSNGAALYDSGGKRLGAMVVLRDITERVQKEIEVSNAIIQAREKERSIIASEIHDGITQSLSVVAMNMKNLKYDYEQLKDSENYEKALGYLQSVIEQSRELAHKIMPDSIKDFGLIEAVKELVAQLSISSHVEISFVYSHNWRMAASKELHLFRVIQEGLGNALKHSGANKIQIRLNFGKDHVRISLRDNGKGFDAKKSYLQDGIGLLSMRDRVKKLRGRFRIFSDKKGTIVWLKVPVNSYINNEENYSDIYR